MDSPIQSPVAPGPVGIRPIVVEAEKPKRRFHIGLHENGGNPPAWNVGIGGVTFHVQTERYGTDGTKFIQQGSIEELDGEALASIEKALENLVVRTVLQSDPKTRQPVLDEHGRPMISERIIQDRRSKNYKPLVGKVVYDEWLKPYVYIREAPKSIDLRTDDAPDFKALRDSIAKGEESERKAQSDPKDQATREKHKGFKGVGQDLPTER